MAHVHLDNGSCTVNVKTANSSDGSPAKMTSVQKETGRSDQEPMDRKHCSAHQLRRSHPHQSRMRARSQQLLSLELHVLSTGRTQHPVPASHSICRCVASRRLCRSDCTSSSSSGQLEAWYCSSGS